MPTSAFLFSKYSPVVWALLTGLSLYFAGFSGLIGLVGIIGFFFAMIMLAISLGGYLKKRGAQS